MKALSSEKLGGLLLTLSFLLLVVGGVAAPSGAYQGPIEDRLAVIDADQAQWILSKVLDGTAVALLAAGGLTLAVGLRPRGWSGVTGGISLGLAGIIGLIYVYRLAIDPGPLYDREVPVPMVIVLIALTAVGVLALSLHFLGAGYPRWSSLIGAVSGAGALVGLALILRTRTGVRSGTHRLSWHPEHRRHVCAPPRPVERGARISGPSSPCQQLTSSGLSRASPGR